MSNGMMTIKDVAARVGRSQQTILAWENEGLISPRRDDRGWRVYTEEDVERMEEIKEAKRLAMLGKAPEEGAENVDPE